MKKAYLLLVIILLIIPSTMAVTEIILNKYPNEEISIGNFAELAQVSGNNLIVEYVIELDIINMSSVRKDFELIFSFTKGEDRFFIPNIKEVYACQPIEDEDIQWGHNYDHIKLEGCNKTLENSFSKENNSWRHNLVVTKEDITPNKLGYTPIYIRVIFEYPNFIIVRPDLKILWLDLSVQPTPRYLERYLKTENDAVIDSLLNYKIIRYDLDKDQFILKAPELGDAQFFYKNALEETDRRFRRDMVIVAISFGISLVFGFLFSENKLSKRTKHLWMIGGGAIFLTSYILLRETNNIFFAYLSLISLITFFASIFLAILSSKKDNPYSTLGRNLSNIWKFIKELIGKN